MKRKIILVSAILSLIALSFVACKEKEKEPVEPPLYPTVGAINARFTVADGKTVVFAQGNLQYQASSGQWRFAANQYDVVGIDNVGIDTTYSGWIDLFGWGTSGFNGCMPYMTDDTNSHYGDSLALADIAGTQYDWGVNNAIYNGGNRVGQWRTLTVQEWEYLLKSRKSASVKKGLATITDLGTPEGEQYGLVLLPDTWVLPSGCAFYYGYDMGYATNVYTVAEWNDMQQAGAVFLPAAGYREGCKVDLVNYYGGYWSSSVYTEDASYEIYMDGTEFRLYTAARSNGQSVRLVTDK